MFIINKRWLWLLRNQSFLSCHQFWEDHAVLCSSQNQWHSMLYFFSSCFCFRHVCHTVFTSTVIMRTSFCSVSVALLKNVHKLCSVTNSLFVYRFILCWRGICGETVDQKCAHQYIFPGGCMQHRCRYMWLSDSVDVSNVLAVALWGEITSKYGACCTQPSTLHNEGQ